jgi:hypothetical protein
MTCLTSVKGDVYEIQYCPEGVTAIVLYRHGYDGRGEEVKFETLHPTVQHAIIIRLRKALNSDKHNGEDSAECTPDSRF